MITIKNAGYLAGYSGKDHLLDDSDFSDAIGRSYRDVRAAAREILPMSTNDASLFAPVSAEILFADGTSRDVKLGWA